MFTDGKREGDRGKRDGERESEVNYDRANSWEAQRKRDAAETKV